MVFASVPLGGEHIIKQIEHVVEAVGNICSSCRVVGEPCGVLHVTCNRHGVATACNRPCASFPAMIRAN